MKAESTKKLKMHDHLSKLILTIGFLLLIFMIYTEDEPGAIPLLLIIVGAGWYFFNRFKLKRQQAQ